LADPRVSGVAVVFLDIGVIVISREVSGDLRDLSASQRPWLGGHLMSARPCHRLTGAVMAVSSKPHGVRKALQSSHQPSSPRVHPSRNPSARYWAISMPCAGSAPARSPHNVSHPSGRDNLSYISAASAANFARAAPRSSKKIRTSSRYESPIPSRKSRSGVPYGPSEASTHTAATPPGNSAAVARAYGPPPENPHTAVRVMPSSLRMARTSAAQSAITRPGIGVDPP